MDGEGITATEAQIDQKTGSGVSTSYTDTMKTQALLQAENRLNVITGVNYSDSFGSLNVDVSNMVTETTASIVAIEAILYDTSGYRSLLEAQTKIDYLDDVITKNLNLLKEKKNTDFITDA